MYFFYLFVFFEKDQSKQRKHIFREKKSLFLIIQERSYNRDTFREYYLTEHLGKESMLFCAVLYSHLHQM